MRRLSLLGFPLLLMFLDSALSISANLVLLPSHLVLVSVAERKPVLGTCPASVAIQPSARSFVLIKREEDYHLDHEMDEMIKRESSPDEPLLPRRLTSSRYQNLITIKDEESESEETDDCSTSPDLRLLASPGFSHDIARKQSSPSTDTIETPARKSSTTKSKPTLKKQKKKSKRPQTATELRSELRKTQILKNKEVKTRRERDKEIKELKEQLDEQRTAFVNTTLQKDQALELEQEKVKTYVRRLAEKDQALVTTKRAIEILEEDAIEFEDRMGESNALLATKDRLKRGLEVHVQELHVQELNERVESLERELEALRSYKAKVASLSG